jgi:hypothetical protein
MVEFAADIGFAMEAVEEKGIALEFRVRNLEGDDAPVAQIRGPKNSGHAASGNQAVDAVVVELIAGA